MQTRSTSRFVKIVLWALLFGVGTSSFAQEVASLRGDGVDVTIKIDGKKIFAESDARSGYRNYRISTQIKKHLSKADEIFPVFKTKDGMRRLFAIVSRERSREEPLGFCGSGYEDHLLLIEPIKKNIVLADEFLLQSCLKSISLNDDNGGKDIRNTIKLNDDNSISFQRLDDTGMHDKTLIIENGHFVLH